MYPSIVGFLRRITCGIAFAMIYVNQAMAQDVGWPREFSAGGARVIVYQP